MFACSILRFSILLYVLRFVLMFAYASEFVGVCFILKYNLSRNLIDRINPAVIQFDFFFLCLSNLTLFKGIYVLMIWEIVLSRMS